MGKTEKRLAVILLIILLYLIFLNIKNIILVKHMKNLIKQSRQIYIEKEVELKEIKEENEEKIEEYNMVEKWNKEIEKILE